MKVGSQTSDSFTLTWTPEPTAQSYVIHYIDKATTDAHELIAMGYVEGNTWTLDEAKHGADMTGKKFTVAVQSYKEKGVGADEAAKARYLHDGEFVGSAWSTPLIVVDVK